MKRCAVQFFCLAGALSLTACSLSFSPQHDSVKGRVLVPTATVAQPETAEEEPAAVSILVFADELHTGLVLDLDWLIRHGYVLPKGVKQRKWVTFSWGDEVAYVQERWLSPGQVFQALCMPSRSVMEVITFDYNPPNVCHHQRLYQGFVPESVGSDLAAFLNACSMQDEAGEPTSIAPSTWGDGQLVRSPHHYYFPKICNVWTVEALNAVDVKIAKIFGLSADGVVRQVERKGFAQIWDPAWQELEEGQEP